VHEGLTLAIVGRPNVASPSLFKPAGRAERAIVTSTPGTTRDLVSGDRRPRWNPVQLVTRPHSSRARRKRKALGSAKSMEALAQADLVSSCWTHFRQPVAAEDADWWGMSPNAQRSLWRTRGTLSFSNSRFSVLGLRRVRTSAHRRGHPGLRAEILRHIGGEMGVQAETGFLTNVRHQSLVAIR